MHEPHAFSIGPMRLLATTRSGPEKHAGTHITRYDTVFVSEIGLEPKHRAPTGHRRGLMHVDIRVDEHPNGEYTIHFAQQPVFPINCANYAPPILTELQNWLPRAYAHPKTGAHARLTGKMRDYSIRSDLNQTTYPWTELSELELTRVIEHASTAHATPKRPAVTTWATKIKNPADARKIEKIPRHTIKKTNSGPRPARPRKQNPGLPKQKSAHKKAARPRARTQK